MDQVNRSCLEHPVEKVSQSPYAPLATFEPVVVAKDLNDAYFLDVFDVNKDSLPDVVSHGLGFGKVVWHENPGLENGRNGQYDYPEWPEHYITTLSIPVAMDHADIDGDGWMIFSTE